MNRYHAISLDNRAISLDNHANSPNNHANHNPAQQKARHHLHGGPQLKQQINATKPIP